MAKPEIETSENLKLVCEIIERIFLDWLCREMSIVVDSIGYDEPLFRLGIDSLGAVSIAAELEVEFEKTVNPEVLYELDTILELAEYLLSTPKKAGRARGSSASSTGAAVSGSQLQVNTNVEDEQDPSSHFARLNRKVNTLKQQGIYPFEPEISSHDGAWVQCENRRMLMLASYEYLGLLGHEELRNAANSAVQKFGTGHHGSRLLTGTTSLHCELESRLAGWMCAEDAIVFSSGYVANLATISALVGPGDFVVGDKLNHASIVDGCRMSGAEFSVFAHNDMDELASVLLKQDGRRTLVVVDAIFSMEGDIVDLPVVVDICKKNNALLMVDEAHSMGVLGTTGSGIQEHFGLDPGDIDVKMGTLSKSLAGSGGFVASNKEIVTYLRHHARGYIFSGALPAVYAQVALAALDVLKREPARVGRIWKNLEYYLVGLRKLGFDTGACETPIVPIMTQSNEMTIEFSSLCREAGLLVAPVCFPAVPMDAPRLRTCITECHEQAELDFALETLERAGRQCGVIA
ncbi:MAG: aminotransferase class I/II-fold pyridoxal phosphate-dependent enzyme [Aureliella sp.]